MVKERATSSFLARHLYNFFVADEPQVPSWNILPPNDPKAVDQLIKAYDDSDGDLRSILRALVKSECFKNARFTRVKSPAEVGVSTVRPEGKFQGPGAGCSMRGRECKWRGRGG